MRDLSKVLVELKKQREKAKADLDRINQAIAALAGTVNSVGGPAKPARRPARPRRRMSPEARKAASDRMKRFWSEKSAPAKT